MSTNTSWESEARAVQMEGSIKVVVKRKKEKASRWWGGLSPVISMRGPKVRSSFERRERNLEILSPVLRRER